MPPEYQRMLERYRKLLAEEQGADAANPAAPADPKSGGTKTDSGKAAPPKADAGKTAPPKAPPAK